MTTPLSVKCTDYQVMSIDHKGDQARGRYYTIHTPYTFPRGVYIEIENAWDAYLFMHMSNRPGTGFEMPVDFESAKAIVKQLFVDQQIQPPEDLG